MAFPRLRTNLSINSSSEIERCQLEEQSESEQGRATAVSLTASCAEGKCRKGKKLDKIEKAFAFASSGRLTDCRNPHNVPYQNGGSHSLSVNAGSRSNPHRCSSFPQFVG